MLFLLTMTDKITLLVLLMILFQKSDSADNNGIIRELWTNIKGNSLQNLLADARFPHRPSRVNTLNNFDAPNDDDENYAQRIKGYFNAPETGDYKFYSSCDGPCEIFLGVHGMEGENNRIITQRKSTKKSEYNKYSEQESRAISLEKDQLYYIEAINKHGTGEENLSLGVELPSGQRLFPIPQSLLRKSKSVTDPDLNEDNTMKNVIVPRKGKVKPKLKHGQKELHKLHNKVSADETEIYSEKDFLKEFGVETENSNTENNKNNIANDDMNKSKIKKHRKKFSNKIRHKSFQSKSSIDVKNAVTDESMSSLSSPVYKEILDNKLYSNEQSEDTIGTKRQLPNNRKTSGQKQATDINYYIKTPLKRSSAATSEEKDTRVIEANFNSLSKPLANVLAEHIKTANIDVIMPDGKHIRTGKNQDKSSEEASNIKESSSENEYSPLVETITKPMFKEDSSEGENTKRKHSSEEYTPLKEDGEKDEKKLLDEKPEEERQPKPLKESKKPNESAESVHLDQPADPVHLDQPTDPSHLDQHVEPNHLEQHHLPAHQVETPTNNLHYTGKVVMVPGLMHHGENHYDSITGHMSHGPSHIEPLHPVHTITGTSGMQTQPIDSYHPQSGDIHPSISHDLPELQVPFHEPHANLNIHPMEELHHDAPNTVPLHHESLHQEPLLPEPIHPEPIHPEPLHPEPLHILEPPPKPPVPAPSPKPDIIKVEFVPEEATVEVANKSNIAKSSKKAGTVRVQFIPGEASVESHATQDQQNAFTRNKDKRNDSKARDDDVHHEKQSTTQLISKETEENKVPVFKEKESIENNKDEPLSKKVHQKEESSSPSQTLSSYPETKSKNGYEANPSLPFAGKDPIKPPGVETSGGGNEHQNAEGYNNQNQVPSLPTEQSFIRDDLKKQDEAIRGNAGIIGAGGAGLGQGEGVGGGASNPNAMGGQDGNPEERIDPPMTSLGQQFPNAVAPEIKESVTSIEKPMLNNGDQVYFGGGSPAPAILPVTNSQSTAPSNDHSDLNSPQLVPPSLPQQGTSEVNPAASNLLNAINAKTVSPEEALQMMNDFVSGNQDMGKAAKTMAGLLGQISSKRHSKMESPDSLDPNANGMTAPIPQLGPSLPQLEPPQLPQAESFNEPITSSISPSSSVALMNPGDDEHKFIGPNDISPNINNNFAIPSLSKMHEENSFGDQRNPIMINDHVSTLTPSELHGETHPHSVMQYTGNQRDGQNHHSDNHNSGSLDMERINQMSPNPQPPVHLYDESGHVSSHSSDQGHENANNMVMDPVHSNYDGYANPTFRNAPESSTFPSGLSVNNFFNKMEHEPEHLQNMKNHFEADNSLIQNTETSRNIDIPNTASAVPEERMPSPQLMDANNQPVNQNDMRQTDMRQNDIRQNDVRQNDAQQHDVRQDETSSYTPNAAEMGYNYNGEADMPQGHLIPSYPSESNSESYMQGGINYARKFSTPHAAKNDNTMSTEKIKEIAGISHSVQINGKSEGLTNYKPNLLEKPSKYKEQGARRKDNMLAQIYADSVFPEDFSDIASLQGSLQGKTLTNFDKSERGSVRSLKHKQRPPVKVTYPVDGNVLGSVGTVIGGGLVRSRVPGSQSRNNKRFKNRQFITKNKNQQRRSLKNSVLGSQSKNKVGNNIKTKKRRRASQGYRPRKAKNLKKSSRRRRDIYYPSPIITNPNFLSGKFRNSVHGFYRSSVTNNDNIDKKRFKNLPGGSNSLQMLRNIDVTNFYTKRVPPVLTIDKYTNGNLGSNNLTLAASIKKKYLQNKTSSTIRLKQQPFVKTNNINVNNKRLTELQANNKEIVKPQGFGSWLNKTDNHAKTGGANIKKFARVKTMSFYDIGAENLGKNNLQSNNTQKKNKLVYSTLNGQSNKYAYVDMHNQFLSNMAKEQYDDFVNNNKRMVDIPLIRKKNNNSINDNSSYIDIKNNNNNNANKNYIIDNNIGNNTNNNKNYSPKSNINNNNKNADKNYINNKNYIINNNKNYSPKSNINNSNNNINNDKGNNKIDDNNNINDSDYKDFSPSEENEMEDTAVIRSNQVKEASSDVANIQTSSNNLLSSNQLSDSTSMFPDKTDWADIHPIETSSSSQNIKNIDSPGDEHKMESTQTVTAIPLQTHTVNSDIRNNSLSKDKDVRIVDVTNADVKALVTKEVQPGTQVPQNQTQAQDDSNSTRISKTGIGNKQTSSQASDSQTTGGQSIGSQVTNQQLSDNQTNGNQALSSQATANQATANQATDTQKTGNLATDTQISGNQATDNQKTGNQPTDLQISGNQATANQATSGNQATANKATVIETISNKAAGSEEMSYSTTNNLMNGYQASDNRLLGNHETSSEATGYQSMANQATGGEVAGFQAASNQATASNQAIASNQPTGTEVTGFRAANNQAIGSEVTGFKAASDQPTGSEAAGFPVASNQAAGSETTAHQATGYALQQQEQQVSRLSGNQNSNSFDTNDESTLKSLVTELKDVIHNLRDVKQEATSAPAIHREETTKNNDNFYGLPDFSKYEAVSRGDIISAFYNIDKPLQQQPTRSSTRAIDIESYSQNVWEPGMKSIGDAFNAGSLSGTSYKRASLPHVRGRKKIKIKS